MTSSSSCEGRREATSTGNWTRSERPSESSSRSLRSEGKTKGGAIGTLSERERERGGGKGFWWDLKLAKRFGEKEAGRR